MAGPIRILFAEDMPIDAALAQREINKVLSLCTFQRVETREDYLQALEEFQPDLIITDYSMPHFDGLTALKLAMEHVPLTPVIVLTGAMNEDTAVECMKSGASDYVIKEHIKRLGQAVVHALEEKQLRQERHRAQQDLLESELRYRTLVQTLPDAVTVADPQGMITYASPMALQLYGYTRLEEVIGLNVLNWVYATSRERKREELRALLSGKPLKDQETLLLKKDGSTFFGEVNASCIRDVFGEVTSIILVVRDISTRKESEQALRESEQLYRDRSRELEALFNLSDQLRQANGVQDLFTTLLKEIQQAVEMDGGAVLLFSDTAQYPTLTATVGKLSFSSEALLSAGNIAIFQRIRHERCVLTLDPSSNFLFSNRPVENTSKTAVLFPLQAENELSGVIVAIREKTTEASAFSSNDIRLLTAMSSIAANTHQRMLLFTDLEHSNMLLSMAYDATIESLSRALDLRDKETEGHTRRVCDLALTLAQAMGVQGDALLHIRRGALLHDIGKIGVPDSILLKPGPLTADEWRIMRFHPKYAYDMLLPIEYLRASLDIPYCHHEKWNGSGYPRGLKGAEIPLAARIFAIVDVWDALINERPYRQAWSKAETLNYIKSQIGEHFDPQVADVFLGILPSA